MVCTTEQTFVDDHGSDSAVLNIAGSSRSSGVDYNPMKLGEDMILNEFLIPKQQPSSTMEQLTMTDMEPLFTLNTATDNTVEPAAIDYEITHLTTLNYLIDPAFLTGAIENVPINQNEVEIVSVDLDVDQNLVELSALNQDAFELPNLGHDFNMGAVAECESPQIIYLSSTDNVPYVDKGLQEMEVPEEILQKYPEQQGDVISTQEPPEQQGDVISTQELKPVPRKRGRKPKGEPGAPRRRNRPKKVKLYEMNQFEDNEKERRRKNAVNAKRHRNIAKDKMSKVENLLAAVTKERDFLKKEVEKLQRNEKSLLMKLSNMRVVTVNN